MKTLYLVRHAKSSWKDTDLSDFERPLNKRGKKAAPLMGKILHDMGVMPDEIISSPATRAIDTAAIIANELGFPEEKIEKQPGIYEAASNRLLQIINKTGNQSDKLMLVGHNPALFDLANELIPEHINKYPTCAVLGINFHVEDWNDAANGKAELAFFEFPKKNDP